jgi:hypothetical protein
MYSPKIAEDLIPRLYALRIQRKQPMTRVVDAIIRAALLRIEKPREDRCDGQEQEQKSLAA